MTVLRADIFPETKSTFFPETAASASMFTIVCVFPVPGGPSKMKLSPFLKRSTASHCELSLSRIWKDLSGSRPFCISALVLRSIS